MGRGQIKDRTGMRYGKLTVLHRADDRIEPSGRKTVMWKCKCDCGNESIVSGGHLNSGTTKSCGCLQLETSHKKRKHGMNGTRIHHIYLNMKYRCYKETSSRYKDYGGRGIKVCDEWLGEDGFLNFYNWSIANGYNDSLSIDRIENDGNYEPSNCRWTTIDVQENNKRGLKYFDIGNGRETLMQICKRLGKNYNSVQAKIYRGKTIEEALELKPRE